MYTEKHVENAEVKSPRHTHSFYNYLHPVSLKLCGSPKPELIPNSTLALHAISNKSEVWPQCGTDLVLHQLLTVPCRHFITPYHRTGYLELDDTIDTF